MQYYYNDEDEAMIFGEFLLSSDLLFQFGLMLLKSTVGVYKLWVPARGPLPGFSVGSASQILVWRAILPSRGLSKAAEKWSPCPLPSWVDRSNMAPVAGSASGGWLCLSSELHWLTSLKVDTCLSRVAPVGNFPSLGADGAFSSFS